MTKNCLFALMLASVALWMGCARGLQSIAPVTVATSPANQSVVAVSLTVQFVATVNGVSSTAVDWSLSSSSCTGSACGTITSAGLYTAPTTLASGKKSLPITVTATSQADSAATGQLTITVLPITVYVTPTPVQVGQGLVQQFTAVTIPDNAQQTFNWTVTCTSAPCGTLTQDANTSGLAVYTAPAAPPGGCTSSNCVTVTATSTLNPSASSSASATVTVVKSRVSGTYTLRLSGYNAAGDPVIAMGSITFDNNGVFKQGVEDEIVNTGLAAIPQHYLVNAATYSPVSNVNNANNTNNAGTLTIDTTASGGSLHAYSIVLDAAGDLQLIESDGNGNSAGVLAQATPAKFGTVAALSGTFVFGFTGTDLNGKRVGYVGLLPMDGAGNVGLTTPGLMDINDGGVAKSSTHVTGTYTMANGVGTLTITASDLPAAPTFAFNLYGVSGQNSTTNANPLTVDAISTDLLATNPAVAGSMVFQDTATYDKTALSNPAVVNLTGVNSAGSNTAAWLSVVTGDGNGNVSGTYDANNAGTIVAAQTFTCTYTSATGGRYVITLLGNSSTCGGSPLPFVFYASGNSRGFLLDQSSSAVMAGAMDPQGKNLNGSFAGSELPGTYAAATVSSGTSGVNPLAANLTLTYPGFQSGSPVYNAGGTPCASTDESLPCGSYAIQITGNGSITLTPQGAAKADQFVIYAIDTAHFWMIQTQDTTGNVPANPSAIFVQR